MQLWTSEVAVDEVKMASDINEWAKKYHPHKILFDKYATQTLATKLEQSGWRIEDCSGQAFYQACSDLSDIDHKYGFIFWSYKYKKNNSDIDHKYGFIFW